MAKAKPRAEAQLRATDLLKFGQMERKYGISTANGTEMATDLLALRQMECKNGFRMTNGTEMATNLLILRQMEHKYGISTATYCQLKKYLT